MSELGLSHLGAHSAATHGAANPPEGATDPHGSHPDGPIASLAAQRRALESQDTEAIEHPGYHGLRVIYRRLLVEESNEILYGGDPEQSSVKRNLQLLVSAAVGMESLQDGQWVRFANGYDRRFAAALEADGDTAREWCLASFGNHEQPMLNHSARVFAWMQTLRRADEKKMLGG